MHSPLTPTSENPSPSPEVFPATRRGALNLLIVAGCRRADIRVLFHLRGIRYSARSDHGRHDSPAHHPYGISNSSWKMRWKLQPCLRPALRIPPLFQRCGADESEEIGELTTRGALIPWRWQPSRAGASAAADLWNDYPTPDGTVFATTFRQ